MAVLQILLRRYVQPAAFLETVAFYEGLLEQTSSLRFDYPEFGLRLAQVGNLLFISGREEALAPFRATEATFVVDDLEAYVRLIPELGGIVIRAPREVPTGINALIRHADGMVVEYVQHATAHARSVTE